MSRILAVLLFSVLSVNADIDSVWTYQVDNGEATITGYSGVGGAVTFPNLVNGISVKKIGGGQPIFGWYGNNTVTSITLPDSVTSIGDLAFRCSSGLTSITLPDSLSSIGDSAFWSCTSLTSINIPNSVTSIGTQAFQYCTGLTSILVGLSNPKYSSFEGILYNKNITSLITCPAGKLVTITLPDSVSSIGDYAFWSCTSLTGINIPNSVTNIGLGAFGECTSLTSITIPDSVTSIGFLAFNNCTGLTSILVESSNPNYSSLEGVLYNKNITSLITCPAGKLKTITFPRSVTIIEDHAFWFCTNLTSITIPSSVTSIGFSAFYYCTSLASITIPNSVRSIGDHAFDNCTNLTNIFLLGNHPNSWSSFNLGNSPTTLVLPKVTSFRSWRINNSFRQELRFNSLSGVDYSIERSTDLSSWANKVNIVGDGSEMTFLDDATNDKAFYRLIQH